MGAICHVRAHYTGLAQFLSENKKAGTEIFGTFLEGENIYTTKLRSCGIIVLGNEGNGIDATLFPFIGRKLMVPDFSEGQRKPESLNVSMAAAIIISEFRRRKYQ
jgi:TrmH family RNA methyltransferase